MKHVDVLVVGAGLSGICAAYYLQTRCPNKTFTIVEARSALGGTWDLFRYPGIRSDSDMHTLGFSFFVWRRPKAIADGASILAYLEEAADEFGIRQRIEFDRRVVRASWSSTEARWTVELQSAGGEQQAMTCGFLWWCSGYYDYANGFTPEFEGFDEFEGVIVHPQHWPDNLDWTGKRVVVIGSGATAVTIVPEMAKTAAHVTMLQRSPTYIFSMPSRDIVADALGGALGNAGFRLARWKNVLRAGFFYEFSRKYPGAAASFLAGRARRAVGDQMVDEHFSPTYDVWDQRLCLIPDGDLFNAIRENRVTMVTEHIARFTPTGIRLNSGEDLPADIIVTATGLQLRMAGGAEIEVDGDVLNPAEQMLYKGAMLSDVPNAAISTGYTNASWTLKCELISAYVCRLLTFMDEHGYKQCSPRRPTDVDELPLIDFNSGYVKRALDRLPTQGDRLPWRLYQNYLLDNYLIGMKSIDDGALLFN